MTPGAQPSAGFAIGVDIGGTKMLGVAIDGTDEIVAEARAATPQSAADPAEDERVEAGIEVAGAVVRVVEELRRDLAGVAAGHGVPPVGVGAPGMVDRAGVLCFAPNLLGASGADILGLVGARLPGILLVVENDANCAAFAEHRCGAAVGADHALVVTLGTGIGGGLVSGGRVLVGAFGFAGEIGHMVVDPSGPLCPCGRRGCWERYASGGGLGRLAREAAYAGRLHDVLSLAGGDPETVRGEHVTRAALQGEAGALQVMEELGWWVALGLANLTAVLDPDRIVLGGGLTAAGEMLLGPTRRAYGGLVEGAGLRPAVDIVPAVFGERAGAAGAAMVARNGGFW